MGQFAASSFDTKCRYTPGIPPARVALQAHSDPRALTVMPSLSPTSRSSSSSHGLRRSTRLLIAVASLAALVALPRAHASTQPSAPLTAAASAPAAAEPPAPVSATAAKSGKEGKAPTCQAIMQRLSGSLAGTPSRADKPGAVMVDFEKSGVTMACSHSDAVAIPVPGNAKPR